MGEMHEIEDAATVEQFQQRLLKLAKSRLPQRLRSRIDETDIVQSVFRSFFRRHEDSPFQFREQDDVWRLLATITFRKVQRATRYHGQARRDIDREDLGEAVDNLNKAEDPSASALAIMSELLDSILKQLAPKHQSILRLRLEGYSVDEIAQQVSVSSRTVERALAMVRRIATELTETA
ncbi:MAG: sigma-70 family RNA polymerase sigma factor [Planctomycetota bacterium]